MSRSKARSGADYGALIVAVLIIWVIIKFLWWIVGAAALTGLFFLVRAVVRADRKRARLRAAHRAAIAARADLQHNWVLRGDDRGIYGVEGAELMHYVYPARDRVQRYSQRPARG